MEISPSLVVLGEAVLVSYGLLLIFILLLLHKKKLLIRIAEQQRQVITKLSRKMGDTVGINTIGQHIRQTIRHLHGLYKGRFGLNASIPKDTQNDEAVEQLALGFALHVLSTEKKAFEQGVTPDQTWKGIAGGLNDVLKGLNGLPAGNDLMGQPEDDSGGNPALAEQDHEELQALQEQLAVAEKRVGGLEKFKKLFFGLRDKAAVGIEQSAKINQEIIELVSQHEGAEKVVQMIEAQRQHYVVMQDLFEEQGMAIPVKQNDDDDFGLEKIIFDSFSKNQVEVKRLREQMTEQSEIISKLRFQASQDSKSGSVNAGMIENVEKMDLMMRDSEMCVETLENELNGAHDNIEEMARQIEQLKQGQASSGDPEAVERHADEEGELRKCIATLEKTNDYTKNELDKKKIEVAKLEEKLQELEARYLNEVEKKI